MRPARIILVFLIAASVSHCVFYYPNLPEMMATHFNAAGKPDGWMAKSSFFLLEAGILLLIVSEFTLLPYLIGKFPTSLINMPNKEYWFAEERRARTLVVIGHFFEWLSAALLALFVGINQLVFRANLTGENLSSGSWIILGAFLIFVVVWLITFIKTFKVKNI